MLSIRIDPRKTRAMKRILTRTALLLGYLLLGLALIWLVSSEDQRRGYLESLGLAELVEDYGARKIQVSAPGVEFELAAPLPPPIQNEAGESPATRDHPDGVDSACRRSGVANPTQKTARAVYRWTDENGRAVFSDTRPAGAPAQRVGTTAEDGIGMFSADYRFLGRERDPVLERDLAINIDGVFRFLVEDLRLAGAEPVHVRLTIINGKHRFARYRQAKVPKLNTTSGFYRFADNEAVVRWRKPARTLAVARHEIAHLALGNWLGRTPIWLNEGLAELVERMEIQQSYSLAQVSERSLERLRDAHRAGTLPGLRDFLAMKRKDWDRIGLDLTYPYAWSLIHYMIEDPHRQRILGDYLNTLAANRCQPFDHLAYLEQAYPGGLHALESAWSDWLARGQARSVTF